MSDGGHYEVVATRFAYDGALSRVRVDQVRMPDGNVTSREIVEHPGAVGIVPVDDSGRVVLVRQYRVALASYQVEIPAGKLDVAGEAEADAARRELIEEVGLDARTWTKLTAFFNSAGWTDELTTVYLATGLNEADVPQGFTPEAEEADMQVLRIPLGEAVDRVRRGQLTDAKTVIGLLLASATLAAGPQVAPG